MARTLIVVNSLLDWNAYYPSNQVITFEAYLATEKEETVQRIRIINLCNSYSYLSDGYYCSLLAEARGHHVIPSVNTLNDLDKKSLYQLQLEDVSQMLELLLKHHNKNDNIKILSYFGTTQNSVFQELARRLFDQFSCPIIEITPCSTFRFRLMLQNAKADFLLICSKKRPLCVQAIYE